MTKTKTAVEAPRPCPDFRVPPHFRPSHRDCNDLLGYLYVWAGFEHWKML